ncbi:MAG TPA: tetratricopeptide repeat protein [Candidatus Tumulicola sp.]
MQRRYRFLRAGILVAIVAAVGVFAAIQTASYAFDASVAAPGSLPTRVPLRFGLAVYRALDRVAPAAYVESTLAANALAQGNPAVALRYALRLPASPSRDELLAHVARARGQSELALEYFLAAPDVDAVQSAATALAVRDPAAAYALERTLRARLARLTTHPDGVAETSWRMGELANERAWREVSGSRAQDAWLGRAMKDFQSAADLAPLSEKFAIAAANQAALLGDLSRAAALFTRAADVNPGSADAVAGLGVIAYRRGDLNSARKYFVRARRLDPQALMVRALARDLHR